MRFSDSKQALLRPQKGKGLSTFFIAILVASAFFVPYMIMGEGYFTFYGDFNVQQIPFYQECHKAVRSGNIFWSSTTDLGANFIGSYSFYLLGSPFFWLTLPFPNSFVPYLMGPLLILKFASAALTAYFYIRRFTRTPHAAQLGAILYAFSGFTVYNVFFNHFHEAVILFPLLLLSLELLITENRRFVFALTVCLCAISNYFFFFGMVVFCVIYFFVRLFSGAIKVKFSQFAVFVFEAVLGLLLAAAILLPSILAIADNSRLDSTLLGWDAIMYGKEQIYGNILQCFFFPPDIPARPVFFPGAEVKWSSLGGWLPLFSTVGLFVWFSQRKKNWLKTLIGICIFMALVPILNSAFYAFNEAYYARWFYMPILMICLATVTLTEDSKVNWSTGYKWVLSITLATTAVIGLFPQKNDKGEIIFGIFTRGTTDGDKKMYFWRYWITCLIAIVSLVILGIILKYLRNNKKVFYRASVACVCIVTVIYANFFIASGRSHSYDVKNIVIDQLIEGDVDLNDDSEFRIDVYGGVDNTSMFLGYSGINAFHSVVPTSIFEFYEYVGVERVVASRPETENFALRPLLSVKYLLNSRHVESFEYEELGETKMEGYTYLTTENDYYVYKNENYVPYGFSYEYYMTKEFCDSMPQESRSNMMLKAILLSDKQIKKYGHLLKNIELDEDISYFEEQSTSLNCDYSSMQYDCEKLAATSAYEFCYDNRGFTAKVVRENENLVFFSVPFDEGWSATVNGKKAEIEKVNAGFMAVKVPAGMSEIRFNYLTPGLTDGVAITTIAAAILLCYIIFFSLFNSKHKKNCTYPEGEILLKEWKKEEIREKRAELEEKELENRPSILDSTPDISSISVYEGFEDGFKINPNAFDEEN